MNNYNTNHSRYLIAPFYQGVNNIKTAIQNKKADPSLKLTERITRLVIGILELIPVINYLVFALDKNMIFKNKIHPLNLSIANNENPAIPTGLIVKDISLIPTGKADSLEEKTGSNSSELSQGIAISQAIPTNETSPAGNTNENQMIPLPISVVVPETHPISKPVTPSFRDRPTQPSDAEPVSKPATPSETKHVSKNESLPIQKTSSLISKFSLGTVFATACIGAAFFALSKGYELPAIFSPNNESLTGFSNVPRPYARWDGSFTHFSSFSDSGQPLVDLNSSSSSPTNCNNNVNTSALITSSFTDLLPSSNTTSPQVKVEPIIFYAHNPDSKCPNPSAIFEEQLKSGQYDVLSTEKIVKMFGLGNARSLSDEEARLLYNDIAQASSDVALKILHENINHLYIENEKKISFDALHNLDKNIKSTSTKIAEDACKTRHDLKDAIRILGPEESEKDAKYMDLVRYGNETGLSCDQIMKKYRGNPEKVIQQSGKPNPRVNGLVKTVLPLIPKSSYIRKLLIWSAVKLGVI